MISREEAKNLLVPQGMTSMRGYAIETAIDEIYDGVDELKAELKAKDERIESALQTISTLSERLPPTFCGECQQVYELKDKDIADTIEFEMIDGSEYELAAALHSLTDDKHGS